MKVPGIPYVQGRNSYSDADGRKYGIAIHNTSNNATAEAEASYATRRTDGTSSHFYCDNDSVIQSLDTNARAGHAGSTNGNNHAVAVEITGTNDKTRAWWLANVAWDKLGQVLAAVCRQYGIRVRRASVAEMKASPTVQAFYSHDDMRQAWGGTTHTDPGANFPWDRLFAAVNAALTPTQEVDMDQNEPLIGNQAYPNRTKGDAYADLMNFIDSAFWANPQYARRGPEANSWFAQLGTMAKAFPDVQKQLAAVAAGQTALATNLAALPGAVAAELEDEGGVDGTVVQAAVERALAKLRLTVDPT